MIQHQRGDLNIRIDVRYNSITIHKAVFREIGEPAFIHFGINTGKKMLFVFGEKTDKRRAIRIRFPENGSFTIKSKPLIAGIRKTSNCFDQPASYLLRGKRIRESVIFFPLNTAQMESGDHDD